MPFMIRSKSLREAANGNPLLPVEIGDEVKVVEEKDGWLKVSLIPPKFGEGWVLNKFVGDANPILPDLEVDLSAFVRQCWLEGLRCEISPHYLVAVARFRCGAVIDNQPQRDIGPFRFTGAMWNAERLKFGVGMPLEVSASDIHDWATQCGVFAAIAARDFESLKGLGGKQPSAAQLCLAQMIGVKAAANAMLTPGINTQAALNVQDAELPAGGLTRDQILAKFSKFLADPGSPPTFVQCNAALERIAVDLQIALDAVKQDVITAGADILGVAAADVTTLLDARQSILEDGSLQGGADKSSGIAGKGGVLGQLIGRGEGDYNTFNRGNAGDSVGKSRNFSAMTIAVIVAKQSLPAGNSERLFAVGKYQIIPTTMRGAVSKLGLDISRNFTPELQEFVFRNYLIAAKRPKIKAFITGANNDLHGALLALALEFASVADPNTGRSHYGGKGGNRASITVKEAQSALQREREAYQKLLASGGTADAAWNGLSA